MLPPSISQAASEYSHIRLIWPSFDTCQNPEPARSIARSMRPYIPNAADSTRSSC